MAEFLVEKLLNALADVVITKLQDEFKLVTGVKDEVKNLSNKLKIINRMLQDVQRRKLKKEPVGIWLEKLEDVAYDMDDVLDEWNTEVQKLKIMAEEDPYSLSPQLQTKRRKVCSFLLSICSCFKQVSVRHDIAQKIKELNGRMNMVFQEANEFKFDLTNLSSTSEKFERISSTSIVNESEVYARESAMDAIASKLLPTADEIDDHGDGIRIVSIVGTGGIGKTTLAQLVYNDNRVQDHFQVKRWICVSDPFDQKKITKEILQDSSPYMSELETLLQRVKASISGKKFLLALDDVWTEDYNKWKPICDSLKDGAPGSRILVTTRSEMVARMMGTNYLHKLDQLSDSDCWKILSRIAFQGRSESEGEKFAGIGMEISKKCKGLPLAANFLGSLLQSKDTVEQWKNVLKSEIWELEKVTTDLFPHIYLSYNELTSEAKLCFLYCAVFPKDSNIFVRDLIKQWMAQGYLSSNSSTSDLESRGYDYFNGLAMRSFFQNFERCRNDEIRSCKMHDIVHDFAQHLTNGECLIIENLDEAKKLSWENVRHLTWSQRGDAAVNSMVSNVKKLRSFYNSSNTSVTLEVFGYLKCVRVLSLSYMYLEEVPRAIRNLIHLRYLDLRYTIFKVLPEEICELYNLETLDVSFCYQLTQFPERLGNLRNLRHLENKNTFSLKQFPPELDKLTSLRTLVEFKVGNGYSKLEYLRNLNQLGGCVRIEFYKVNEINFESAKLRDKIDIVELHFNFESSNNNGVRIIGEQAQIPQNLQRLYLYRFPNTKLPSWIMSLDNVVEIEIYGGKLTSLPALGKLPSLEILKVEKLEGLKFLRREFLGIREINTGGILVAFPKLKLLVLDDLTNLRIWEDLREKDENKVVCELKIMPRLEWLHLSECNRLKKLPHVILRRAESLSDLSFQYCDHLTKRYDYEASTIATDWIHISHISRVQIDCKTKKFPYSQPSS